MPKQIIALLIAIDDYAHRPLQGCLNDLADMESYLQSHFRDSENLQLVCKPMRNEEATREGIIEAFSMFDNANEGDICLFYFSGHGVQFTAPEVFWTESDRQNEALVCHGPNDGNNLLIDKELSCLIANSKADKNEAHFLVITDCCHAGTNTKNDRIRYRTFPDVVDRGDPETYWGFNKYDKITRNEKEYWAAPVGRHIKLSSCLDSQLSGEMGNSASGEIPRGLFTWVLLDILRSEGGSLSYANLIAKTQIRLDLITRDQMPTLSVFRQRPEARHGLFLGGALSYLEPVYEVWSHRLYGWVVQAGQIHGLTTKHQLEIVIEGVKIKVGITKTHSNFCVLQQFDLFGVSRDKILTTKVILPEECKLNLHCLCKSTHEGIDFLDKAIKGALRPSRLSFDSAKPAKYLIRAEHDGYSLTHPADRMPVFRRVNNINLESALAFVQSLEQVARWHQTMQISMPEQENSDIDVEIRLSKVLKPHLDFGGIESERERIEQWENGVVFRYNATDEYNQQAWQAPAFELSVVNKTNESLWIAGLYCGSGYDADEGISTLFSITDEFMPSNQIEGRPDASYFWLDNVQIPQSPTRFKSKETKAILLSVLDDYFNGVTKKKSNNTPNRKNGEASDKDEEKVSNSTLNQQKEETFYGLNEIKDYIKIIVSKDFFDSSGFEQAGLPIHTTELTRKKTEENVVSPVRWRSFDIPVTIVRPREETPLSAGSGAGPMFGLTFQAHRSFSARIILNTFEELIRTTAFTTPDGKMKFMKRPELFWDDANAKTIFLTSGMGNVEGLAAIDLHPQSNVGVINEEAPLWVHLKGVPPSNGRERWIVSYIEQERIYAPLAKCDENGDFKIEHLPPASKILTNGLTPSIKLFFVEVDEKRLQPWKPETK